MYRIWSRTLWILSAFWASGAVLSLLWPGKHLLFGRIPLTVLSAEKPFFAALFFCLGAWLMGRLPRLEGRVDEKAELRLVWSVAAFAGSVWAAWGLVKTAFVDLGMDIGIYATALWNTAHGRFMWEPCLQYNFFGEHFIPLSLPLAPLVGFFESAGVLIVAQAAIVPLAIPAVYLLARRLLGDARGAWFFTILFLLSPFLHRIMGDPYRPATMAIPLILWGLYHLESGRKAAFFAFFALTLLVQESLPMFTGVIGLYFLAFRPGLRRVGASVLLLSIAYFALVVGFLMPRMYGHDRLLHMEMFWSLLPGNGPVEILLNFAKNPYPVFKRLFSPFTLGQVAFFTSTVFFLCWGHWRVWILFLIPMAFIQLSDFMYMRNFSRHYTTESLIAVFYASLLVWGERGAAWRARWGKAWQKRAVMVLGILVFLVAGAQFPGYYIRWNAERAREFREFAALVPADAQVCISKLEFYTTVAWRHSFSRMPEVREAPWVLLTREEETKYRSLLDDLEKRGWSRLREGKYAVLYHKNP
ncbi:MAG: DUF2079 domain-containing protein [Spirochaetes bacterium]|nr:DUF2079 domain-containing protein [Spirochaetota bacterium]